VCDRGSMSTCRLPTPTFRRCLGPLSLCVCACVCVCVHETAASTFHRCLGPLSLYVCVCVYGCVYVLCVCVREILCVIVAQ